MGLPDIIIEFSKKAVTAIQNGSTGIVGIMLKDAKNTGAMVLRSVDEIPTGDKVSTPKDLVRAILLSGEIAKIYGEISELAGFGDNAVKEVKNS